MRNFRRHILVLPLVLYAAFGCLRIEEETVDPKDKLVSISFEAVMEDNTTKTALEGSLGDTYRNLIWLPEDSIGVSTDYQWSEYYKFTNTNEEASEVANFHGEIPSSGTYYAVYPYSAISSWWDYGRQLSINVPKKQVYAENTFSTDMNPMVAHGLKGEILQFKNLCGILAVNLKGEDKVKSISLAAYDASGALMQIAGTFNVNMDFDYSKGPELTSQSDPMMNTYSSIIEMDCGDGVQLDPETPVPFHFVLAPGEYSSISITVATTNGKIMIKEGKNPLTIKRAEWISTSALQYVQTVSFNLSSNGYANSYVISEPGIYSLDATVIGNGEFGLIDNAGFHTSTSTIAPSSAKLLWEDTPGIIRGLVYADGKISIVSTGVKGNALVGATDADGKILWSWHLWFTDEPEEQVYVNGTQEYTMLDRNIGAIRADRGTTDLDWTQSYGLQYQWGRKDPFSMNRYERRDAQLSMTETINYPHYFASGNSQWTKEWSQYFWSPDQKTIYDPCPAGYRVPVPDVWSGFTTTGGNVDRTEYMNITNDPFNDGWYFNVSETEKSWYPANPQISYWASFDESHINGNLWTSINNGTSSKYIYYYYNSDLECGFYFSDYFDNPVYGKSIRCMKDERVNAVSVRIGDISDLTSSSAKISCNVATMGDYEIVRTGFVYGYDSSVDVNTGTVVYSEKLVGDISLTIDGLAQYTKYYIRAFAVTNGGEIFYSSKTQSFMTPNESGMLNLSRSGTANSYIVPPVSMRYSFNATVIGNGDFGLVEDVTFHTANTMISPSKAEILWEDRPDLIEDGSLSFDGTNISFVTTGVEGNALIVAKDANDKILWSWHIWITDIPEDLRYENTMGTFIVQDRNLGATRADRGNGETWKESTGLDFQWGRKDPFAGGFMQETNQYYYVADFILHPNVWANSWDSHNSMWLSDQKTIYDPCPVGYRVSSPEVWSGFSKSTTYGAFENGWYFMYNPSGDITWYPNRGKAYNTYTSYWGDGYMLSATLGSVLYYSSGSVYTTSEYHGNLRCMKDDKHVDMAIPLVDISEITDITTESATIHVIITDNGDSAVTERGIIWGTESGLTLTNANVVFESQDLSEFSINLTGLNHSDRYYVTAYAKNDAGVGYSQEKVFYTSFKGDIENLSQEGTANSYIVRPVYGEYSFDASVKGNSKESVGEIDSVEVLWETANKTGSLKKGSIVEYVELKGNKVHFRLPFEPAAGNALVAVKDALGTILWSWHIWVVDFDPLETQQTYKSGAIMMDRNLGATSVVPIYGGAENSDYSAFGLYYQWGRKDPLPFLGTLVPQEVFKVYENNYPSDANTIEYATQNPTVVYDDVNWNWDNTLWASSKTKYDPCPPGWRVPDMAAWSEWDSVNTGNDDYTIWYSLVQSPYSSPDAYYPLGGDLDWSSTFPGSMYDMGYYRSTDSGYVLTAYRTYVHLWNTIDISRKALVRCMKEQKVEIGDNEGYTGSDYDWE